MTDELVRPRFAVFCPKFDGSRREWRRYHTMTEAVAVAQALQAIGLAAYAESIERDDDDHQDAA